MGLGAGLDDRAMGGESVDDGGAEPRSVKDLEGEFGAAVVEFHVAEFVHDEQGDAAVPGDGALIGGRLPQKEPLQVPHPLRI